MSEPFWDPGSGQEAPFHANQEPQNQDRPPEPQSESSAVTMSVGDFAALEERIVRAVDMVRRERQAKAVAEDRARLIESQLEEQVPRIDQLEKEVQSLKAEREQVRQRVERLLAQLDALEL
jgi:predicted ribosome quality control (RQC) complex YloA/Tae2 family protein